jgi:hypothetical protein
MAGDKRVVWVLEDGGADGFGPLSLGVFSARLEGDDAADGVVSGPRGVSVDEALVWARARAECVIVSWDAPSGTARHFCAAARQPAWAGVALPVWPPDNLDLCERRHPEYLQRGRTRGDAPISWDVRVSVNQGWGEPVPAFAGAFADRLRRIDGVELLDWVQGPGGGMTDADMPPVGHIFSVSGGGAGNIAVKAKVRLQAATVHEAVERAEAAAASCVSDTLSELGVEPRPDPFGWGVSAEAYPAGSVAARSNTAIREPEGAEHYASYQLVGRTVERCVAPWETIVESQRTELAGVGLHLDDDRWVTITSDQGLGLSLGSEPLVNQAMGSWGPVAVRDASGPLTILSGGPITAVAPINDNNGFAIGLTFTVSRATLHVLDRGDDLQALDELPPDIIDDVTIN